MEKRNCKKHSYTNFSFYTNKRKQIVWYCVECNREKVKLYQARTKNWKRYSESVKQATVNAFKGKCSKCGYKRSLKALHFHHKDFTNKEVAISKASMPQALKELKKGVLLCNNCHALEEKALAYKVYSKNGLNSKKILERENGICKIHGETLFVRGKSKYCALCHSENIANRKKRVKHFLVVSAGGKCTLCGIKNHICIYDFHHIKPKEKVFHISGNGLNASKEKLKKEYEKCLLLCSNCHAEIHDGFYSNQEINKAYKKMHAKPLLFLDDFSWNYWMQIKDKYLYKDEIIKAQVVNSLKSLLV